MSIWVRWSAERWSSPARLLLTAASAWTAHAACSWRPRPLFLLLPAAAGCGGEGQRLHSCNDVEPPAAAPDTLLPRRRTGLQVLTGAASKLHAILKQGLAQCKLIYRMTNVVAAIHAVGLPELQLDAVGIAPCNHQTLHMTLRVRAKEVMRFRECCFWDLSANVTWQLVHCSF